MRRALLLTAALLAGLTVGCRTLRPDTAKDADDVRVGLEEADRAFLYSRLDQQQLAKLSRPSAKRGPGPRLYTVDRDSLRLHEIVDQDQVRRALSGREGLIGVSVESHGATVNLWNWITGKFDSFTLRLDSLSAHLTRKDGADGELYDVVFAAKEPAIFPLCRDRDYEIFKACLRIGPEPNQACLLQVRQLTHNRWDDTQPAFSPDGHWIVFVSEQLGPSNVALMDADGNFLRLLTRDQVRDCHYPVVLPDNEQCLYLSDAGGVNDFFVCGLDASPSRRASAQELKDLLFSWDDATRHAYLLTSAFASQPELQLLLKLPRSEDLRGLVALAELNSPLLKQYRESILASRAERAANQKGRGAKVGAGVEYLADVGALVKEPSFNPGDRPIEGFSRYLFTLSFPLFQGALNKAIAQRDLWQEIVYCQTYRKQYDELVYRLALSYADYSEFTAQAALLSRVLDLQQKRKFLWEVRVAEGRELPGKLAEADAIISETRAALTAALGKADAARVRLLAAVGLSNGPSLRVIPAPLDWQKPPAATPALGEFQALAQINHPDLARLKFLELRAAAIRDMGPEGARNTPTLSATYGYGTERFFSKVVDDFISFGIGHSLPLDVLGLKESYREQWTHEMLAYQHEREQARQDLNADLAETRAALVRTVKDFQAALDRQKATAEKVRLSRIYQAEKGLADTRPHDVVDQVDAEIAGLTQAQVLVTTRAEYSRQLAKYYYRAGLSKRWLQVVAQTASPVPQRQRSLWLWRSLEVVLDPQRREQLMATCADQGVTRLYCFVSRVEKDLYLEKYNYEFGYFLDLCRSRGIEVYALMGNPQWVDEGYRPEIGALLDSVATFNARTQEGKAGFAGLKLDVEPHALPEWKNPQARGRLVSRYLQVLDYVRELADSHGLSLKVSVDVPTTYAEVPVPGQDGVNLFGAVCSRLSEVTVMDYANTSSAIIARAEPLVPLAEGKGTALEIGVETAPGLPKGVSFSDASPEELLAALNRVYEHFAGEGTIVGFAIHDYSGFAKLLEKSHGR